MKHNILLLFAVLATAIKASAYGFEVGGIYYNILSQEDLTCEVTYKNNKYNSYSGDIVIPSTVTYSGNTFSVTSIGDYAFAKCISLTSVEIPNSVTKIGGSAFYNCSSLESFSGKFSTEDHRCLIIDGILNFFAPAGLTSYEIPNSVTSIGDWAFYSCSSLTSVVIPNSVTSIGDYAFYYCSSLISVTISNSVTSIGKWAFSGCTSLTSVVIPNSVTSIGMSAFLGCSSLTSVEISNSVTSIGRSAFQQCSNLTSVMIPNSVTEIGGSAFSGCTSLTSVVIPNSVTEIGGFAFSGCSSLISVTIPNSITSIEGLAFSDCPLGDVFVSWNSPAGLDIASDAFYEVYKITLHVPVGTTENYKYRSPWNNFKEIVEYAPGGDGNEMCETPNITVKDNGLSFYSSTPNAKYYYTINCNDNTSLTSSDNGFVNLKATYEITVYAYADGYKNSETVTATLVWVNPTLEGSSVMSMEAKKAVLVSTQGGSIIVSGTERGEGIQLYSIDGRQLCSVSADDGQTVIPCKAGEGEVVIVKYGGKAVKVLM